MDRVACADLQLAPFLVQSHEHAHKPCALQTHFRISHDFAHTHQLVLDCYTIMGRSKGKKTRPQLASRDHKTKPVAGSKTVKSWTQTKQGITFQSRSKTEEAPNPRARWIDVKLPGKYAAKCSFLGFRGAWTPDYRRDALWIQLPIDSASKLGQTVNGFTAMRPIGFNLTKKTVKDDDSSISLTDVFPGTDASWLSDATALIAQDLLTVEVHLKDNNGEPLTLLQPSPRRQDSLQPKFALSIGIAWQRYMDVCLYKPGFAWPPTELVHVQMHRAMLWVLRASQPLSSQWSFRDHEELTRLYDEFVCSANGTGARDEELEPPAESTCVEFVRGGISLGYDPYRACFLGLL